MPASHLSPKVGAMRAPDGAVGAVALAPIRRGEAVAALGTDLQMAGHIVGDALLQPDGWIDRSSDPNCGVLGSAVLVALRDIAPGEQLSYGDPGAAASIPTNAPEPPLLRASRRPFAL